MKDLAKALHVIRLSSKSGHRITVMILEAQFICCHSHVFRNGNKREKKKKLMKDFVYFFLSLYYYLAVFFLMTDFFLFLFFF